MTLQEKLDGKLPKLSTLVWEELEKVFDAEPPEHLAAGVTVCVFKNEVSPRFCYLLKSSNSNVGKKFSFDFNLDTLKEIIKIAEENGLRVETVTEGSDYNFIYSPSWSK